MAAILGTQFNDTIILSDTGGDTWFVMGFDR